MPSCTFFCEIKCVFAVDDRHEKNRPSHLNYLKTHSCNSDLPGLSLQALGLAIPVHGAPESPLPALEDWDVLPILDESACPWCFSGYENVISALQLLQLFPAPPEPCWKTHVIRDNGREKRHLKKKKKWALAQHGGGKCIRWPINARGWKWCITQQTAIDPLQSNGSHTQACITEAGDYCSTISAIFFTEHQRFFCSTWPERADNT